MTNSEILGQLRVISDKLSDIQSELKSKQNLYCPGCRTLQDVLNEIAITIGFVDETVEQDKIDQILEISKELQRIAIEARAEELRTQLLDGMGPKPLISEVMTHE